MRPFFSIIMPTFNSASTLEAVLDALDAQTISPDEIELLVIDGGSCDDTVAIAENHGATIIPNPKRLPEYAKSIGLQHASGRFIIKLDSDEELISCNQLSNRKTLLQSHPEIKALLADRLLTPPYSGIATSYVNSLGDPFTYFCYHSKGSVRTTFKRNIVTKKNGQLGDILLFNNNDIRPIGDSGSTTLDLDFIREHFSSRLDDVSFACACFDEIVRLTNSCACIDGDDIMHHSSASFRQYLKKLDFRIINNLFHKEESGFSSREAGNPLLAKRKKLFAVYVILIAPVILDSIRLALVYKDPAFLLHFVYVYYICIKAAFYLLKSSISGRATTQSSYGKQ